MPKDNAKTPLPSAICRRITVRESEEEAEAEFEAESLEGDGGKPGHQGEVAIVQQKAGVGIKSER